MSRPNLSHLQIYQEEQPRSPLLDTQSSGALPKMLQAFEHLTGLAIRYISEDSLLNGSDSDMLSSLTESSWQVPVIPGIGAPSGQLIVTPPADFRSGDAGSIGPEVRDLVQSLAGMLEEQFQSQHALWQREAELAAGVPIIPHTNEDSHLAARLEAVLAGGCQAIGCQAAGAYLLDESTTSLKLRACHGLPLERLTAAPRQLQGSLADLEAMLGHAVVLENNALAKHWCPPETFSACVCVPISTPTTVLGTLWFFSETERDFDDSETNIAEMIAGRVASDLEREMLMNEGIDGARLKGQMLAAQQLQRNQMPTIAPILDDWDLAGWASQVEPVGGDFYDWFTLPDSLMAVVLADVMDHGVQAAISASAVKASIRAHGQYQRSAVGLLRQVNQTMWSGSAGEQFGQAFVGYIDLQSETLRYATAGRPTAIRVTQQGWELLNDPVVALGIGPDTQFRELECQLGKGDSLLLFSDGVRDSLDANSCAFGIRRAAELIVSNQAMSARDLVILLRDALDRHIPGTLSDDCSILIAKHT